MAPPTVIEGTGHAPPEDVAPPEPDATAGLDLLVARIGSELFALPVSGVEEVVEVGELLELEERDAALLGVAQLRGRLLPVYRTDAVLGAVPALPADLVLVLIDGARRIGIAVDDAEEVVGFEPSQLRPAAARGVDARLVRGVVLHDGKLLTVLDCEALAARFGAAVTTEIT